MPSAESQSQTASADAGGVRTVSFVSLGCPKNLVDSEKMLGQLAEDGLVPVSAEAVEQNLDEGDDLSVAGSEQDISAAKGRVTPADAVVVNTCGFLEASKNESMAVIEDALAMKRAGEIKRVVVAGCLVQRHRAKLFEWAPGIDALIGVFDRDKITEAVRGPGGASTREANTLDDAGHTAPYWISGNALVKAKADPAIAGGVVAGITVNGKDGQGLGYFESDASRLRLTPRHYAYLRISEGCNQKCAFCTIPSIRGKMRSKGEAAVLDEARELLRDGAHELLLIGQDTTSYGDDIGRGLADGDPGDRFSAGLPRLLSELERVVREETGRGWLRLMYAYPTTFTDPVIDAFAELAARGILLPYIDIPLQHASDNMLTAMRRNVTARTQRELIDKLRERIPGMAVRTTFISGFPGETDADHEQLLEFIEHCAFEAVGVFTYSTEPGTPAGTMADDPALAVPHEVALERKHELMALQQALAFEQNEYLAEQFDPECPLESGLRFDVLIDEPMGEDETGAHLARGRTYFQAPQIDPVTYVRSRERRTPGELVRCVLTEADGYDLIAVPVDDLGVRVSLPLA